MIKQTFSKKAIAQLEDYNRYYDKLWFYDSKKLQKDEEKAKRRFYPAVIVCCEYHSGCCSGRSLKGLAKTRNIKSGVLHPKLENELQQIAIRNNLELYQCNVSQNGENVYVGTCAEDDACNQVLNTLKTNLNQSLSCMSFTPAVRPRTREYIPYCKTCEEIFG